MARQERSIIHLHPQAPPKPDIGGPCNGCGVCCAWRPCPLGILSTRSLDGPCRSLLWEAGQRRYRCGWLAPAAPGAGRWRASLTALRVRLAARWIAAGQGCDSSLQPEGPAD